MRQVRVAVVLAALLSSGGAGVAWAQSKGPAPLPAEVVAAWEKAGAKAGWMRYDEFGFKQLRQGGTAGLLRGRTSVIEKV